MRWWRNRLCKAGFQVAAIASFILLSAAATVVPAPPVKASVRPTAPWTDNHCGSCHQIDSTLSHPINIAPMMAIPSRLPVESGRMTCITCHAEDSASHARARATHDSMLREGFTANTLCIACHDHERMTRSSQHAAALGRAHFLSDRSRWQTSHRGDLPSSIAGADAESRTCMTCHDGVMSMEAAIAGGDLAGYPFAIPGAGPHPLGIDYHRTSPRKSGVRIAMVPQQQLDPRIRLFDGKIGCGSCHSPYSKEKHLLVMSNLRSALCLACHKE